MSVVSESEAGLKDLILYEIKRLAPSQKKEDLHLANNVLRPMLLFIDRHNETMGEMARIGSKHTL